MTCQLVPLLSSHVELDAKWVIRVDGRSIRVAVISSWATRSRTERSRKGLCGARWLVRADQRLRFLSVLKMAGFVQIIGKDMYRK